MNCNPDKSIQKSCSTTFDVDVTILAPCSEMWVSVYSRTSAHVSEWCMDDEDELDRQTFYLNPGEKDI